MVVEKKVATLLLFAAIFAAVCGNEGEELCLSMPRAKVTIHVVVRGNTGDVDVCGSWHLMHALKRRIYNDFNDTSGEEMCHFKLDSYTSCGEINFGKVPRTVITFETNLTCGDDRCFKHIDYQTSKIEINRQYDLINEIMNIFRVKKVKYNNTDVIIRYFFGESGPVIYACKEASREYVIEGKNLTLCKCPKKCMNPGRDVTFSFEKPVYYFTEGISNAKIYVEKIKGSIDEEITLLAFIFMQGELRSQNITFGPNDTKKAVIFFIPDDNIALEPTKEFELFLNATDRNILLANNKTIINVIDDDDELLIGLAQNVTVMEGNNATLCVNFNSEFETNFSINVRHFLTNLTLDYPAAVPDEDFYLSNHFIEAISTLHSPNNSLCFNIVVIQDEFAENEECFGVSISLPNSVSSGLMVELDGGKDTAVVCIQDDY